MRKFDSDRWRGKKSNFLFFFFFLRTGWTLTVHLQLLVLHGGCSSPLFIFWPICSPRFKRLCADFSGFCLRLFTQWTLFSYFCSYLHRSKLGMHTILSCWFLTAVDIYMLGFVTHSLTVLKRFSKERKKKNRCWKIKYICSKIKFLVLHISDIENRYTG